MSETRAPVVFISHHSSQVALARALKARVEAAGMRGWMAADDIIPGPAFEEAIVAQMARSDGIVLLFSGTSDQSRHVKRELILAEDNGKPVYPVRLENILPQKLAYWLQDYQWIDWLGGKGPGPDRLIETIKRNAGQAAMAPPAPAAAPKPRRNMRLAILAAALILAAAGGAGWYLLPRPPG